MNNIIECDLSKFGYREIEEAIRLLKAYQDRDDKILNMGERLKLCVNLNSGYVFLTDEDLRVFMADDDCLEEYFNCFECGYEDFAYHFENQDCKGCQKIFKDDKELRE